MRDYAALYRFIAEREAMPFEWWPNDCVTYAAGAVEAQTGNALVLPAPWSSEEEAEAAIEAAGGLVTAVGSMLTPIPPAFARRGDVAGVQVGNRLLLAIVEGDTLVGPGPTGNKRLPRRMMTMAWSAE